MYSFFTTSASVKRKSAYVDNKSSWALTGTSYKGYFKPAGTNTLIDQDAFGKEYHFTTKYEADIQDGDILVIDGIEYNVKAIQKKVAIKNIKYTFCQLILG